MKRRHLISLALCSTLLAACSDKPADATATGFSGIDITGADYATGFSLTDTTARRARWRTSRARWW